MAETARLLRIHGRVQGVCYRAWAVETAHRLGVGGWVRNRADGTVEMLVHGSDAAVRDMIESAREGPPVARIERIDVAAAEAPASSGFATRPTL
jgi:acylphosphatase